MIGKDENVKKLTELFVPATFWQGSFLTSHCLLLKNAQLQLTRKKNKAVYAAKKLCVRWNRDCSLGIWPQNRNASLVLVREAREGEKKSNFISLKCERVENPRPALDKLEEFYNVG